MKKKLTKHLGAVLMIHLAMAAPEKFLGITVIDPAGKSLGFKEWGEQKLAAWQLEKKGFTSGVEKFLMWHLFGMYVCNLLSLIKILYIIILSI